MGNKNFLLFLVAFAILGMGSNLCCMKNKQKEQKQQQKQSKKSGPITLEKAKEIGYIKPYEAKLIEGMLDIVRDFKKREKNKAWKRRANMMGNNPSGGDDDSCFWE